MTFDAQAFLSDAALAIRPSPIREVFHLLDQPGMISFAGGMPDPDVFPVEEFARCADVISTEGRRILQYGTTEGYMPLRESLLERMSAHLGREISGDQLLVTSGSIQVCDLITRATVNRGDLVVTEEPTFSGNSLSMANHGARFITIPCDDEGMIVDLISERVRQAREEGHRVRFIYTITNFHNPLGCTLSLERRKKLLEIAHELDLLIFEDDPYRAIRFEGEPLPTIYSLDDWGRVVYAGSFSKILAPGTRVAWCVGPAPLIRAMAVFKQGTDTCTSVVAQGLVHEYCRSGALDRFLPKIVGHYRKKRDAMEQAFREFLPEGAVTYTRPEGGFFYWLTTPGIVADDLFARAIEKNVAFVPGRGFFPNDNGGQNSFRMCFTYASEEEIRSGVEILGSLMKEML